MAALLERNRAEIDSTLSSVLASTEADRDRWRERALAAEDRLWMAQHRLMALFE